jgi:hypothetical protein
MSDHADFAKPLDLNSYDACLQTIDSCDYFVLFVGARVGGWYNESDRISITRAEYQHAYDRFEAGQLRLILFVRKDLWNVREDRKALLAYLQSDADITREINDLTAKKISESPSKFANDAEAIFAFIDEIMRRPEMVCASKSGLDYPKGNWVHAFDSFQEIATVLRQSLGLTANLKRRGFITSLKAEIVENVRRFLGRGDGVALCSPIDTLWTEIKDSFLGQLSRDMVGTSEIETPMMNTFCIVCAEPGSGFLQTTFLEEAVRSGEFLDYDKSTDSLVVGPIQCALVDLLSQIEKHRLISSAMEGAKNLLSTYGSRNKWATINVQNTDLIVPLTWLDSFHILLNKFYATYSMLSGGEAKSVLAHTTTASDIFNIPLRCAVTSSEAKAWLEQDHPV